VAAADAVVAPTSVARRHGAVIGPSVPLAIDMYIPTHLEALEPGDRTPAAHAADVAHQVAVVGEDLARGDLFLCAGERQRDLWLGALAAAGRVNPGTYGADPSLRRLVDVVPFGLPSEPPVPAGPVLRSRFPGIGADDPLVVWGGGVYDWLDPLSVVRAVDLLRHRLPTLRMVFLGMRNPHPDLPEMGMARRLRALSGSLGLTDRHIWFSDEWVPAERWGATLLDADVAVSTHPDHLETRFSARTRVLDYVWARRPMVLTAGDELSNLVDAAGVGVSVAPGDVEGIAYGLHQMLSSGVPPAAFDPLVERFRWRAVVAPLLRWAADPKTAPDRTALPAPAPAPGKAETPSSAGTTGAPVAPGVPSRELAAELARRAVGRARRAGAARRR
jgi:hypothetical protein